MQHRRRLLKPVLIIGVGNPSRGDDALGPMLIERLEVLDLADVELLTDFQLQVEYAIDLQGREAVIFVDASLNGDEPYDFRPIEPAEDNTYSSHAMSPAAVLHAYRKLYGEPPKAWVMGIRGYEFDLGEALSPQATHNLDAALAFLASSPDRPWFPAAGR
jgi:hydrogenase maturation protease